MDSKPQPNTVSIIERSLHESRKSKQFFCESERTEKKAIFNKPLSTLTMSICKRTLKAISAEQLKGHDLKLQTASRMTSFFKYPY